MSPVPAIEDDSGNMIVDFPQIAEDALDRFEVEGMNIVYSTDDIDSKIKTKG